MMWRATKLGNVLTLQRGYDLPHKEREEGPYPIVSSSGVTGHHSQYKTEGPGVVTGRYGTLGEVFYIPGPYWPLNTALWVKDFKGNDVRFIFYLLQTMGFARSNVAGAVPGVNRNVLHAMDVRIPPLPTQRRIAGILSAYDDLIENNTKRIKILEEMARALYREWFVHFRFPGHEKVKLVDSALGQIPEGWEVSTIGAETVKVGSGATPKGGKGAYKTEGITLIRSLNIYDFRFDDDGLAYIDETQASKLDNVIVEPQDVLLNITGASVARCCMARERHLPARVNQHVAIIRANKERIDPCYLLCTINNDEQKRQLLTYAQGGATREALTKGTIERFPLLVPQPTVLSRFVQAAGAFLRQREVLEEMNGVLRRTRDLLLPRLISGEIDVDKLEELPEAAQ